MLRSTLIYATTNFLKDFPSGSNIKDIHLEDYNRVDSREILNFLSDLDIYIPSSHLLSYKKFDSDLTFEQNLILTYIKNQKKMPAWLTASKQGLNGLEALEESHPVIHESLDLTGIFVEEIKKNAEEFLLQLQEIAYQQSDEDKERKRKVGRRGERLSKKLEERDLSRKVIPHYIYDNLKGYDIEVEGIKGTPTKFIEVKSTNDPIASATAEISRGQIDAARDVLNLPNKEYIFHFWSFYKEKKYLAKVTAEEIIPYFSEETAWNVLRKQGIYLNRFKEKFQEVDISG